MYLIKRFFALVLTMLLSASAFGMDLSRNSRSDGSGVASDMAWAGAWL